MKELNFREQTFIEDLVLLLEKYEVRIDNEIRNGTDYTEDFISIISRCGSEIDLDLNECIKHSLLDIENV